MRNEKRVLLCLEVNGARTNKKRGLIILCLEVNVNGELDKNREKRDSLFDVLRSMGRDKNSEKRGLTIRCLKVNGER